jgi:hypothetical protein
MTNFTISLFVLSMTIFFAYFNTNKLSIFQNAKVFNKLITNYRLWMFKLMKKYYIKTKSKTSNGKDNFKNTNNSISSYQSTMFKFASFTHWKAPHLSTLRQQWKSNPQNDDCSKNSWFPNLIPKPIKPNLIYS